MKKILLFLVVAFAAIPGYSQSYFEKFIEPEDGVFREAEYVVETQDHGFIINCRPLYKYLNDELIRLTADGEITHRLVFQIDGKNLKYCSLLKSQEHDDEYMAIAVLTSGYSSSSYTQNELAFLRFDSDLNITSQNICPIGDKYVNMSTTSTLDYPKFAMNPDGTFFMAAHCLKDDDSFCYLFAKITADGEIVSIKEDSSLDESVNYPADMFARNNGSYGVIICSNKDQGGQFYHIVDSSLNCVKIARFTNIKFVHTPQYIDTTFKYLMGESGTGVTYDDTTFLLTGAGLFLTSSGKYGSNHFIAKVNDSVAVSDALIWDRLQGNPLRMPAGVKALSFSDDAIYHCGYNGHYGHGQIYSTAVQPTVVTVNKFDRDLNLLWRRYYSANDNSYEINLIQATEDGGCIITGVSAKKPNYTSYMSYVLKLDADGYNSVDENSESMAKPYYCYPNPAKDYLYIELSPDVKCQSVEIYDLEGRLVETFFETSPETTINISNLDTGVYIMNIKLSDGKEYSEKIVKE